MISSETQVFVRFCNKYVLLLIQSMNWEILWNVLECYRNSFFVILNFVNLNQSRNIDKPFIFVNNYLVFWDAAFDRSFVWRSCCRWFICTKGQWCWGSQGFFTFTEDSTDFISSVGAQYIYFHNVYSFWSYTSSSIERHYYTPYDISRNIAAPG